MKAIGPPLERRGRAAAIFLLVFGVLISAEAKANRVKFIQKVVKTGAAVFSGGAGAYAAGESTGELYNAGQFEWDIEGMQFELDQMRRLATRLRKEMVQLPRDYSVFSILVELDSEETDRWFTGYDIAPFHRPDLFVTLDVEGEGTFLCPKVIHEAANGTRYMESIAVKAKAHGNRLQINLFDDDSFGDAVWNSIMQTRVSLDLGKRYSFEIASEEVTQINGVSWSANFGAQVGFGVSGDIQLLNRDVEIDSPDLIGQCLIEAPEGSDDPWMVSGDLVTTDGARVGTLQVASVWNRKKAQEVYRSQLDMVYARIAEIEPQLKAKQNEKADKMKRGVFFGILAIVLLLASFKLFMSRA